MALTFQAAADVVLQGHLNRAYPAAVVEVGNSEGLLWRQPFGRLSYEPDSAPAQADTIFDLASLTKVLATTTLAMQLVEAGRIALTDRVGRWIPEWRGNDREHVTLKTLVTHRSGLEASL